MRKSISLTCATGCRNVFSTAHRFNNQGEEIMSSTMGQQTGKLPSDIFLWAALGSIGTSAVLRLMGKKNASLFVGDWVAPFMLFGVYNKIVKTQGSDRATRGH